jgi:glycosyltransferase involved in cell wall biosynthesis
MKDKETRKLPSLSVFFPAYNEEGNIAAMVKQALEVLPKVAEDYEVIVVDDGSQDKTYEIVKWLSEKFTKVRVVTQENLGYGGAVKRGFSEVKHEWVFYSDADRQFDLSELKKFIPHTENHDLVIGYRTNRAEGFKRHLLAKALKVWNKVFLGFPLRIKDIDCAFKLIHRDVLKEVLPLLSDGAMVSTELLFKAHRAGFSYEQVGVRHYPRQVGQSTGSNPKVIAKAVRDTFILRKEFMIKPVLMRLKNAFINDIHDPLLGLRVFIRSYK